MSIETIKRKLNSAITRLCEVSWMFSKCPQKDFTQNRKLPFRQMISILLAMEGGSLTSELLRYFGCTADTASGSAFVQQRGKINADAFPSLFDLFVEETDENKLYKGLRLIAADGSDIHIPTNPDDPDSYFPGSAERSAYSILHLDAMYDLLQRTYTDAVILGARKANERSSLCKMIASARTFTLGLRKDGSVVATGSNTHGQCNVENWKNIVSIAAAETYSLGIDKDGNVWISGSINNVNYSGIYMENVATSFVGLKLLG